MKKVVWIEILFVLFEFEFEFEFESFGRNVMEGFDRNVMECRELIWQEDFGNIWQL